MRLTARSAAALVAALVVGVFSAGAKAAPGDLDPTFSGDGKQRTELRSGLSQATATVLQPNGKIVAVGTVGIAGGFALARYNPNGSLDTSFSGDGMRITDFGGSDDGARAVALQADGKIVAVGGGGDHDFVLARYNPNGSLDTSFSGDGKQIIDWGGLDWARGVAIQADGKIVVVGRGGPRPRDFALARYNPNGSLDTSFSGDGKQTTDFGGFDNGARAVAIQTDDKIVVVGRSDPEGVFALARYNPNGSLDPSFSGDGKQTTDFGGAERATGVALQGDGKIVVVGRGGPLPRDFAIARYNSDGALDTSFSGDGKQTTDFGGSDDGARAVAIQTDDKIVVVGRSGVFALARYNPNGSLDRSFSGDGRKTTNFGDGRDGANGVAIQTNGKIVAVGGGGTDTDEFALARYNPSGLLDPGFSGDGRQTTDFGGP
jgi:uncharacterized delta-60 repeat protein